MNAPHPPPETLAGLAHDDSPDAAGAQALAHVAECATCRADLEVFRGMRQTLRSLPPVPMPAEVASRLEAALAAAAPIKPGADIFPLTAAASAPPSRWRSLPYQAAAAIIVVLALAGSVVFGLKHRSSPTASSAHIAAAGVSARMIASGTNYTEASLRAQVAAVVNSKIPQAAPSFPGLTNPPVVTPLGKFGSSSASAGTPAPSFAAPANSNTNGDQASSAPRRTAASGPLADPAALQSCIQTLLGGKAEQPLLVDYATYGGAPATVIVLPDPDQANKLDIYVLADTANCAKEELTAVAFLPPTAAGP